MEYRRYISILCMIIIAGAAAASSVGVFYGEGPFEHPGQSRGVYSYQSIRGEEISIYGKGLYRHMSEEVAVQGIAQDYITLFVGVPFLIVSLIWARRGSLRGRYLLAGTLTYFFVGYLFYLIMAMYNPLFLLYTLLMGCTFFALMLTLLSIGTPPNLKQLKRIDSSFPRKYLGIFLIFNAAAISVLWLGVVVPPLLDGSIYPLQLEHYTTLIVQGMDLGLLLPLAVVSAVLLLRRRPSGYLAAPVYVIFLTFQMLALTAKLIFMGLMGYAIIPPIFIIPTFLILAGIGAARSLLQIRP